MDYSISNKTSIVEISDSADTTEGDLVERYNVLKKQYEKLTNHYDATKQDLHEVRRNYETSLEVQGHLTTELENYQTDEEKRRQELLDRIASLQEEIATLRQERTESNARHASDIKKLKAELDRLKEELSAKCEAKSPVKDNIELEAARAARTAALSEAEAAKIALEASYAEVVKLRTKNEELLAEIAEMSSAADVRREELKAAADREAALISDLTEAKALQATGSQELRPHAAKGNSIFAEVEDKRQEMAKTLLQMKQTNSKLRRQLAQKQSELDSLLYEKQTIWDQEVGATAHHDRELIESYEDRITQLEGHCERQRRELARWFGKLDEKAALAWLPRVLEHMKDECERLRAEVLSRGAAQLAGAAQIRELRRKVAQLTMENAKLPALSPPSDSNFFDEREKVLSGSKGAIPKSRSTLDDVKKRVTFN